MILEKIFKLGSLGKNRDSFNIKNPKLGLSFFRKELRNNATPCYCISVGGSLPKIGRWEEYDMVDDKTIMYGLQLKTEFAFVSSWGFRSISVKILGFGLFFSFQDGNY